MDKAPRPPGRTRLSLLFRRQSHCPSLLRPVATNGATPITITGTQFQTGATVNVNNLPADNVQFVSATSITATTPALPAGTADVTVINPDGGNITAPGCVHVCAGHRTHQLHSERIDRHGRRSDHGFRYHAQRSDRGQSECGHHRMERYDHDRFHRSQTPKATLTRLRPLWSPGTGLSQIIYFAKNIAGEASNPNEVTVTFSGAAPAPDVRVLEYKGLDIANPFDVTARRLRYLQPGRQRRLHYHHRQRNWSWLEPRWPAAFPLRARASQLWP